jgi:hypothetical protein
VLHIGHLAGQVLEVVNLAGVALLDHLLPTTGEQLPKVSQDRPIPYGIF